MDEVFNIFKQMQMEGVKPNIFTCTPYWMVFTNPEEWGMFKISLMR